jgi:predicted esterase
MFNVPTVAAFAIALLPAPILAQIESASEPVRADDLTPYAGTYTIASPGVTKTNYMKVLERHFEADDSAFGSREDARDRLMAELARLEDTPHDTVVNNRNGHTWAVSAPTAAAEGEPHGLFVFISPRDQGNMPDNWQATLEKHRLIWVGPNEAGNQVSTLWRVAVALESVDLATQRYTIDQDRIFISGHSGGARVASTVALFHPDRFAGGIYFAGVNWYEPTPIREGRFLPASIGKPPDLILELAQARSRHVIVHGTDDTVATYVPSLWDVIRQSGFRTFQYLSVEGHGHGLPDAEWLERGLAVLDGPLAREW